MRRIFTVQEFIEFVENNKEKFINYCEIIILRDGKIDYNFGSHTEELYRIVREDIFKVTCRESFENKTKPYHSCWFEFLLYHSRAISVWYNFQKAYKGRISTLQKRTLRMLSVKGIIKESLVYSDLPNYKIDEFTFSKEDNIIYYINEDNKEEEIKAKLQTLTDLMEGI